MTVQDLIAIGIAIVVVSVAVYTRVAPRRPTQRRGEGGELIAVDKLSIGRRRK